MSSVEERIEIYHHDSDRKEDWSYGCPNLDLMGYSDVNELIKDIEELKKQKGEEKGT